VTEVTQVDGIEHIGRTAAAAVLCVGGMGHARQGQRVILNAEIQHPGAIAAEVGDHGIVCIQNEQRMPGSAALGLAR
jgi:hypothetical protein